MPLPADYQSVTVHGKWTKFDGSPETGSVRFAPSQPVLVDLAHSTIIIDASGLSVALDNNGEVSIALPSTDDPDITGTPFSYNVTVSLSDYTYNFALSVPVATVGTLELATVTPTLPGPPAEAAYVHSINGQYGALTTSTLGINGHGTLAARPSGLTVFDAGFFYTAEDENNGTIYLWTGTAWERVAAPVSRADRVEVGVDGNAFGVKGTQQHGEDGAMTLAAPLHLTSASSKFLTNAKVGMPINVEWAGPGGSQKAQLVSGSNILQIVFFSVAVNNATGGTWTYTHTGLGTTGALAYNIAAGTSGQAGTLTAALEALYGVGKVTVTLTGTKYTITLLSGAASQDVTIPTTNGTGLTGVANGPNPALAKISESLFGGDLGKPVHVPGAGVAGGVLVAYFGYFDADNNNKGHLYTLPPDRDGVRGVPVNSSAATGTFDYFTRNWSKDTIAAINSDTDITLTTGLNSGAKVDLSGLNFWYGDDDLTPLTNALAYAVANDKWLDLGSKKYIVTGSLTSFVAGSKVRITGDDWDICGITTDGLAESCRLAIGGRTGANNDTADGSARAKRVVVENGTWRVPGAHYRGTGGLAQAPPEVVQKTGGVGFMINKANNVVVRNFRVDNCYAVGFNFQSVRYGLVVDCWCINSWADGFHLTNTNGNWDMPRYGDVSYANCTAINCGDDMFTINHRHAYSPRPRNCSWVNCRAIGHKQLSLGHGFMIGGSSGAVLTGCQAWNIAGGALGIWATSSTNPTAGVVVTNPGGTVGGFTIGAALQFPTVPPSVTAGTPGVTTTTQVCIFNSTTGQVWIGDVVNKVDSQNFYLQARADQATTIPFTGTCFIQYGTTSDGTRFGFGGNDNLQVTNFWSDTASLNTAGDTPARGSVEVLSADSSNTAHWDIKIRGLVVLNAQQSAIIIGENASSTNALTDQVGMKSKLARDITIEDFYVQGTGFSTLTALSPWPGALITMGQDIALRRGKFINTRDGAVLVNPTTATNVGGRVAWEQLTGSDIGRAYTAGAPLAAAFNPGSSTNYKLKAVDLELYNPSGTSGGTQYVSSVVLQQPATLSTIRGVESDITGQALLIESGSGVYVITSPVHWRGKGSPEGVVTAPVGAIYERSDGGAGTCLYVKESGTGNTGWIAYGAPGASPAPELDYVYTMDPLLAYANTAWGAANRMVFMRCRAGGSISNINYPVGTASGNVIAAVYGGNGSTGKAARPSGAPRITSASTAVAGTSQNQAVPLGGSVVVTGLVDWLMIILDNTTVTVGRVAGLTSADGGFQASQDAASFTAETVGAHALSTGGVLVPLYGT